MPTSPWLDEPWVWNSPRSNAEQWTKTDFKKRQIQRVFPGKISLKKLWCVLPFGIKLVFYSIGNCGFVHSLVHHEFSQFVYTENSATIDVGILNIYYFSNLNKNLKFLFSFTNNVVLTVWLLFLAWMYM